VLTKSPGLNHLPTPGTQRQRRTGPIVLGSLVLGILVALVGVAVARALSGGPTPAASPPTAPPSNPPAASAPAVAPTGTAPLAPSGSAATASAGTVQAPPEGPLHLPAATGNIAGVPVGYPHTTSGAISAAYHFTQALGSTLSPDRGAAIAHIVTDPSYSGATDAVAAAIAGTRQRLGLPARVPTTESAFFLGTPSAYLPQGQPSRDDVDVYLLVRINTYSPTAGNDVSVQMVDAPMHWNGSDWRLATPHDVAPATRTRLTVDPNGPTAAALGWRQLSA